MSCVDWPCSSWQNLWRRGTFMPDPRQYIRDLARPVGAISDAIPPEPPTENPNGVVLLGEAPGATEVCQGGPFRGDAGNELNSWLNAANIDRGRCWVVNAFPFRPRQNRIRIFFGTRRIGDQQLGRSDCGWCHLDAAPAIHRLRAWLRETQQIRFVLTLGRIAYWAAQGEPLNGIVHNLGHRRQRQRYTVVALAHPSWIMRFGNNRYRPCIVRILNNITAEL